jgi:hypothetical protein
MSRNRPLTPAELDTFGKALDAVRARTVATLGQRDADYIRQVAAAVRWIGLAGRLLLMTGAIGGAFLPALLWPLCIAGTLLLALSKILENMELGHNVMHGQYDWMNEPQPARQHLRVGHRCTADNWRHTHNYMHHTYTNVRRRRPRHRLRRAAHLPGTEVGAALPGQPADGRHPGGDCSSGRCRCNRWNWKRRLAGEKTWAEVRKQLPPMFAKMRKQFCQGLCVLPADRRSDVPAGHCR